MEARAKDKLLQASRGEVGGKLTSCLDFYFTDPRTEPQVFLYKARRLLVQRNAPRGNSKSGAVQVSSKALSFLPHSAIHTCVHLGRPGVSKARARIKRKSGGSAAEEWGGGRGSPGPAESVRGWGTRRLRLAARAGLRDTSSAGRGGRREFPGWDSTQPSRGNPAFSRLPAGPVFRPWRPHRPPPSFAQGWRAPLE